LKYSGNARSAP